jgi:hypothetical protein
MKRAVFFTLFGCAAAAAVSGSAQVTSVAKAPAVTSLEGADLYRARHVLRRFFANERRPECYRVLFSIFEGNLRVDFVPRDSDLILQEGEPEDPNARAPCGHNVGYVIDRRGNVLRRIYSR